MDPIKWQEIVRDAEDRFWDAIAEFCPDAETGDLPPDVDDAFHAACLTAANEWKKYNLVTNRSRLVEEFEMKYKTYTTKAGIVWTFGHEYPGFFAYHAAHETIFFTPDHTKRGEIDIAVDDNKGHQEGIQVVPYHVPLTAEGLLKLVAPWLEHRKPPIPPASIVKQRHKFVMCMEVEHDPTVDAHDIVAQFVDGGTIQQDIEERLNLNGKGGKGSVSYLTITDSEEG